jgi:hypothetical protein
MTVGRFFGKTGRGLAVTAAILAAIGLTTAPRAAMQVGSAPVRLSGSGSEPSRLALCSRILTTITRIIPHTATTATTHPPQLTIRRQRILRPHGVVGAPIIITITPVE